MTLSGIWASIVAAKTAIIVGIIAFSIGAIGGYLKGYDAASNSAKAERALANVAVLDKALETGEIAAAEQMIDAQDVALQEKELTDAIADTPDTAPDAVRVQLGCQRLRSAGTREADLPAQCRPESRIGSEAAPNR